MNALSDSAMKHGLQRAAGLDPAVEAADDPKHTHMLMMRIIGPVINFVDKPWKVSHNSTMLSLLF